MDYQKVSTCGYTAYCDALIARKVEPGYRNGSYTYNTEFRAFLMSLVGTASYIKTISAQVSTGEELTFGDEENIPCYFYCHNHSKIAENTKTVRSQEDRRDREQDHCPTVSLRGPQPGRRCIRQRPAHCEGTGVSTAGYSHDHPAQEAMGRLVVGRGDESRGTLFVWRRGSAVRLPCVVADRGRVEDYDP